MKKRGWLSAVWLFLWGWMALGNVCLAGELSEEMLPYGTEEGAMPGQESNIWNGGQQMEETLDSYLA